MWTRWGGKDRFARQEGSCCDRSRAGVRRRSAGSCSASRASPGSPPVPSLDSCVRLWRIPTLVGSCSRWGAGDGTRQMGQNRLMHGMTAPRCWACRPPRPRPLLLLPHRHWLRWLAPPAAHAGHAPPSSTATAALFFNHGQCCAAGARTYVHKGGWVGGWVGCWLRGWAAECGRVNSFQFTPFQALHRHTQRVRPSHAACRWQHGRQSSQCVAAAVGMTPLRLPTHPQTFTTSLCRRPLSARRSVW